MRFFGRLLHPLSKRQLAALLTLSAGSLALLPQQALAQSAPYVLPYTITTYAGGRAPYTAGYGCGTSAAATMFAPGTVAIDTAGDGCPVSLTNLGIDPHDVRIDGASNLFFIDSTSSAAVVHKVNPYTQLETIYVGNLIGAKACASTTGTNILTKYGDGCTATDGVANTTALNTLVLKGVRGLGIGINGDLFIAGYNDDYDHKIAAATDFMTLIAGGPGTTGGTAGYSNGAPLASEVSSSRGIGPDLNGNVYIADTTNNAIREWTLSTNTLGSALNAYPFSGTKSVVSGVAFNQAQIDAPEDVQVDSFGNIYIADSSDNVIRAVYEGFGTLPGITGPLQTGSIYTIAGYFSAAGTANPYTYPAPTATTTVTPTVPATTVTLTAPRKFSLDSQNNLYIADSGMSATIDGTVWFVDHATGYIRAIAGYGIPTGGTPVGCAAETDTLGDGCPAPTASLYPTYSGTNTDLAAANDSHGNLYITDAEGGAANAARLRKVSSGLNFPGVTVGGASATQNVLIHFAPGDTLAAAVLPTSDFSINGSPASTLNADTTTDVLFAITFKPTLPGYETAALKVTSTLGAVSNIIFTGTGTTPAIAFDPGNTALIATPAVSNSQAIALDGAGNAYIADTGNNRILFRSAINGNATTVFAGTGSAGNSGNGGAATSATLNAPRGVTIDTNGNVFIADTGNNAIRKVAASGIITLYAGGATAVCGQHIDALGDGCLGLQSTFSSPTGIVADNVGNLYVADTGNNLIREIWSNSNVTVFAGGGTSCTNAQGATDSLGDGCAALATTFSGPTGLAFDATGNNILVADTGNNNVRKISLGTTYKVASPSTVSAIEINPVTLVAGSGTPGTTLSANGTGVGSQLTNPAGVAADAAGNVYIADTGNAAIRLVTSKSGLISTIAGISGTSGSGTLGGAATATQLTTPAAVAVTSLGILYIADSGNNRILSDTRSAITYNFGRTNQGFPSPVVNFTELNIGVAAATLPAPPTGTQSPVNSQLTLTAAANSAGTIPACASGSFATGAICNLQGQFTPTTLGSQTSTYTQAGTGAAGGSPSITLTGTGAVLTPTNSVVTQTSPTPPAQAQYGASLTLSTTVTPTSCNTAAPSCAPTGTVVFVVDGTGLAPVTVTGSTTAPYASTASQVVTGLAVGQHTISCNYSGDDFYAASSCGNVTITVAAASTTSLLSATNNNATQYPTGSCTLQPAKSAYPNDTECISTVLTATVASNTIGTPTGTVTFSAVNGTTTTTLGTASLGGNPSMASLTLDYIYTSNGVIVFDNTLAPGTYTLTCTYNGASNFAISSCTGIKYVVLPQTASITIPGTAPYGVKPCVPAQLYAPGQFVPELGNNCPTGTYVNGIAQVATAQGATTDATVFMVPSNTLTGTLTFSCSNLPADTNCTFSPTSIALTPGVAYTAPVFTDVTFFNDIQPGSVPGVGALKYPSLGHGKSGIALAAIIGWPLTLLGLAGLVSLRRKSAAIKLMALLFAMVGTTLTLSGCAGPGDYNAVLTPTGTYPVTFTVTNGTVSTSVVIDYTVTPGIKAIE